MSTSPRVMPAEFEPHQNTLMCWPSRDDIWDGQIVEGSCGHLVKGLWKDLSNEALPDAPDVPFVLTRQTGW